MKPGIVVILYYPDIARLDAMVSLLTARGHNVALIDNSPQASAFDPHPRVSYHHCNDNVGIAAAQNRGIKLLIDAGCSEVIVFDQDSHLTDILLDGLFAGYLEARQRFDNVAAVGPQIICEFNNRPVSPVVQKSIEEDDDFAQVKQIIASGMLISVNAYLSIGEKEENLFIDGVDHEWCWRARSRGFNIIKLKTVPMLHRQGDDRVKFAGLTFKQGSPIRLYYQVRNVLILSRRNYVPFYWKLRNLPALPLRWFVNRFYFPQGKQRGQYFFSGLRDGLRGKTGKIVE